MTGRIRNKDQQEQQQQDENSPLAEAIKKMKEVERRLSKTDTGEETRKTQQQIVKELDQILEQLRNAKGQGSGSGRPMSRMVQQAGNKGQQPGQQQGQQNGANAQGVGPQAPRMPDVKSVLAEAKDTWGSLPAHLREEMDNVFREEMLPGKSLLIRRYYLSITEKSLSPRE